MSIPRSDLDRAPLGLLCALPEELGSLRDLARGRRIRHGLELLELEIAGFPALACAAGVGKVMAARAASVLLSEGAKSGLFVVGTCGGLRSFLRPGTFVHCTRAVQVDLAVREGREVDSYAPWRKAWLEIAPGHEGWFLTADRPVLTPWRRLRLARAFTGPCVAEMETAAAGAVAFRAGVRWAALRAVTDLADPFRAGGFRRNFGAQAGRAADTWITLVEKLAGAEVAAADCLYPPSE
jgi:nucleoside phosphorylase